MSLQSLLAINQQKDKKQGISEQRLQENLPQIRKLISFFKWYPDLFVDFIKGPDSTFKFLFYQRVFLRCVMRHRYVYATFPRAYSKSFLSVMALMLRCTFYPNSHLFVTTGGKEQAASITMAKVEEICHLLPVLEKQINWERGKTTKGRDNVRYVWKNGSTIDILTASEKSRGQRRTGGLMQECVLIDGQILNEVIIPTTNVDRQLSDGTRHPKELINKSQIYITTAGWKNTFAYDKLIELLVQSIINPDEVMIMGGTYTTPVKEGLLNEDFVDQLKISGTFNPDSFDRQYRSIWSGDAENAFFSGDKFDKQRTLLQPQYEYSGRSSKSAYYVLGIDVGRIKCTTQVCIFKVTPQPQGAALKSLVNLYSYEAEDFEEQAINIKRLYYKYKARVCSIDANGLGIGLIDFMTKTQIDPQTGEELPPFGVEGGTAEDTNELYKKIRGPGVEENALYLVKANAPINTQAYTYTKMQLGSGKIKMLINESQARVKLMSTKVGQNMSPQQRNDYLMPFVLTDSLKAQTLNLIEENEGVNIILKQSSRGINKDKFSAFVYGLYYIKQEEDRKRKRKSFNIQDFLFLN